eukprot:2474712-Pyramimonas_sp.AAC.1
MPWVWAALVVATLAFRAVGVDLVRLPDSLRCRAVRCNPEADEHDCHERAYLLLRLEAQLHEDGQELLDLVPVFGAAAAPPLPRGFGGTSAQEGRPCR